ncbi:hypothetical protein AV274_1662 [Blastocystis sp. ATCC 50177/Nand II]|uniref:Uncharacterized protein n=1 Tax=Blastocystis sp. subtype 1 (strain ATCC 50177 / NandII) TaxID=478820 RepID=A0A196SJY7_BLAHN|nr:hypothetical protein AV274_1662 [Blastocystis sp. ATCC 50177/Nand II]
MMPNSGTMTDRQIAFSSPVYCMNVFSCPSFLEQSVRSSPHLILCGGGGRGKTGISNFITIGEIYRKEDGSLSFKALTNCNTDTDLVLQVVSSSNGKFVFGSLQNGTVVYRVEKGDEKEPLKLEKILFQETDTAKSGMQNVLVVRKDDKTIITGGDDGTLYCYRFEVGEGADAKVQMKLLNSLHLFDCAITTMTLNPTEKLCVVGSEKGEIAIIELSSMGVTQRIQPTLPRTKVRTLLFTSATVLLALMNEGRVHSHVFFLSPESDASDVKWQVTRKVAFKNLTLSCMHFDERSSTVCAGSNEGGVGVFDYPSFRKIVKMQNIHGLAVSSITCIPPTTNLLKNAEKDATEEGWVISSSIDYTVSVLKCKKAQPSQCATMLPVWLFLLIVLLYMYLFLRK